MVHESAELLRDIYLFKDLTAQEIAPIAALAHAEVYGPGDEIFAEEDIATSLYVIHYGSVGIRRAGKSDAMNVTTLGTGSHFGDMSFLDGERRSASVAAIEKAELFRIDFGDLHRVLDANPTVAVKVFQALALFMCGRLRKTTNDLTFARERLTKHE